MKNISELRKSEPGTATVIQLQRNGILKEHTTGTTALLLYVSGFVTYEYEKENEIPLEPGDYVLTSPHVKHWLYASVNSKLFY
jgi:quercetin dioxygenase-like cupin family protein